MSMTRLCVFAGLGLWACAGAPETQKSHFDDQLGVDDPLASLVKVPGLKGVDQVMSGSGCTCTLGDGRAQCWGSCEEIWCASPDKVSMQLGEQLLSLDTRGDVVCGIAGHRTVWCWGLGQPPFCHPGAALGTSPTHVMGLTNVTKLASNCAIDSMNNVYCWGSNDYGQLGIGTKTKKPEPPQQIPSFKASVVSCGDISVCAVDMSGHVYCWGSGFHDTLGAGSERDQDVLSPQIVPGLEDVDSVSMWSDFVCALLKNHTAKCWGNNDRHQLGADTGVEYLSPRPIDVQWCVHSECDGGKAPLDPNCSACAGAVCAKYPECCTDEWSWTCVTKAIREPSCPNENECDAPQF